MKLVNFEVGLEQRFFLIAGPCVIESLEMSLRTAEALAKITQKHQIPFLFKSSFDKANRTSSTSKRGPGIHEGLEILAKVKAEVGVPILTDVHTPEQITIAAQVVDMIQTPAFLCRQSDLIVAAGNSGVAVNIKKGQFLSPQEMVHVVGKAKSETPDAAVTVCERGVSFGYNNLVVDMRSLEIMRETQCPVVFDATHSVQLPGGANGKSGGQRQFVPTLARAAVAVGVSGLFMETHPNPDEAWSDGPNAVPLEEMDRLLGQLVALDDVAKAL